MRLFIKRMQVASAATVTACAAEMLRGVVRQRDQATKNIFHLLPIYLGYL